MSGPDETSSEAGPVQEPAGSPEAPTVSWVGGGSELRDWLAANRGSFTDEALVSAAMEAGHQEADVRAALGHLIDDETAVPVRARARRIVTGLYLIGYLVMVAGMLKGPTSYGTGPIGSVVLTFTLGLAYLLARAWLGRHVRASDTSSALPVLLSIPVILWFIVSGLCVATGLPFGWLTTPSA